MNNSGDLENESSSDTAQKLRFDVVFEGGGVKGIGLVGALQYLEEQGYEPVNIAGSSAGSLVAVLRAAGYTPDEIEAIMWDLDFRSFKDPSFLSGIPFAGPLLGILFQRGIYKGDVVLNLLQSLLAAKNVTTFKQLRHPEFGDDPNSLYRHKVQVIVSDVTKRRLLRLPADARQIGFEPDDLPVAETIRMSSSIPIFFWPVRHHNPGTGEEHLLVDGGMLSNFPVWIFDSDDNAGKPAWPTFGLKLVEDDPAGTSLADRLDATEPVSATRRPTGIVNYVKSLVGTMMEAHDRLYIEQKEFARTIPIDSLGIRTTQFELSQAQKRALLDSGRRAAEEFLKEKWDFEQYVEIYRTGRQPASRTSLTAQQLKAAD